MLNPESQDMAHRIFFRTRPVAEGDKFNSRWQRHRDACKKVGPTLKGSKILTLVVESPGDECDPFRVGMIVATSTAGVATGY